MTMTPSEWAEKMASTLNSSFDKDEPLARMSGRGCAEERDWGERAREGLFLEVPDLEPSDMGSLDDDQLSSLYQTSRFDLRGVSSL
jgi:hypothetical protein